jgi:dihydropteroate synthase
MIWRCGSYLFDSRKPVVMGILNVTPDSFSDGGQYNDYAKAVEHAREMHEQGAMIIDVGGESTRPGSAAVSVDEELSRVIDVVRQLADLGMCVSIDTRHAEVARACVQAGAAIINDVSGFTDPAMVAVAADCDAGLVVMHMPGTPQTMQQHTGDYDDVVAEVKDWLGNQAAMLERAGIARDRICLDPGPGFGKTADQTMMLMRNFHEFMHLGYPVMCAVSRKSYIGSAYHIDKPADRDDASAQEALMACELGASVVRTHNVGRTMEELKNLRPYVLLGLGCNVPLVANPGEETEGKVAMLNQAISSLCMLPDTQVIDISSFYRSVPAYLEDQDDFVNAVVLIRTGIPPKELLGYLHTIEDSLGRTHDVKNGPRTCDIDILDYQMYVTDAEELTMPHPRLLERDFVVKPINEILPHHVLANDVEVTADKVSVGEAHRIDSKGNPLDDDAASDDATSNDATASGDAAAADADKTAPGVDAAAADGPHADAAASDDPNPTDKA